MPIPCTCSGLSASISRYVSKLTTGIPSLIARFMGPTWGPAGANSTQVGPMLAPWTLLSGMMLSVLLAICAEESLEIGGFPLQRASNMKIGCFHWLLSWKSYEFAVHPIEMFCCVLLQLGSGVGSLSQFSLFCYFLIFFKLSKQTLFIQYHVYIWQVSPQLSCGGTCDI